MRAVVIVDIVRTASGKGRPGGALADVHPADLLAIVIRALIERTGLDPALVDDVIAGCAGQYGDQSFNIARTALPAAGLPVEVPGTTVDRQCGSSQQTAHFAAPGRHGRGLRHRDRLRGRVDEPGPDGSTVRRARPAQPARGALPEPAQPRDRCRADRGPLEARPAAPGRIRRESHRRAAANAEAFTTEIVPVTLPDGSLHTVDETVRPGTTAEVLAGLRAAYFAEDMAARYPEIGWHITAGNSSPLTDGASAALIMSEQKAAALGLTPRARFLSFAVTGSDPEIMLTGPIPATRKVLSGTGLTIDDIDVYEVNEAFASVPLAWTDEFAADPAKLNPRGGAIALGHPLGGSGTRLMTTMLHYLEATGCRYGLQTMCEGGGMANATLIERI